MEQQTSNNGDFILERMKKIQFNRPISVTLIIEETNVDEHNESVNTMLNELNQNICSKNDFNNTSKETSIYSLYTSSSSNTENKGDISYTNNKLHCNIYDSTHSKASSSYEKSNITSSLDKSDTRQLITLMDRISDNILLLANSSFYICNTYKNNPFKYKNALDELSRQKNNIYRSCYTTITSIIIPLENNHIFIQKFIDRTVAIAHSKSWHYITSEIVKYIIVDLITWTKTHNQVLETKCKEKCKTRLPDINANLNNILNISKTTTDATNVCIFSHGSPGEEVTININSQVLKNFLNQQNSNIENSAKKTTKINNCYQKSMHTCKRNHNQVKQKQSTCSNNKISNKRRRCQKLSNMSPYNPLQFNGFRTS